MFGRRLAAVAAETAELNTSQTKGLTVAVHAIGAAAVTGLRAIHRWIGLIDERYTDPANAFAAVLAGAITRRDATGTIIVVGAASRVIIIRTSTTTAAAAIRRATRK